MIFTKRASRAASCGSGGGAVTVPAGGASVPASTGAREDSAAQAMTKASGVQHNNPVPEAISECLARRGLLENVLAARDLGDEARAAQDLA
ncbi:hypothetical protein [Sorangium sp. So ce1335]|uniref:hypothetical protein n=1 Tax=Sorangium sp. So ce1335 TaxID=3133335 RepID=UPI003F5EBE3F